MTPRTRQSEEPHDRLTILANEMIERLRELTPDERVRCVVLLDDGEMGGIGVSGYDTSGDAIADIFVHLKAMFEANGQQLMVVPLGKG
jgi:hypothetical protein